MRVVYIDSLFLLNLAVNYLLMLATAKICALKIRKLRFLLGAAFGAAYAALTVIPGVPAVISLLPVRIAVGVVLALIAFGAEQRFGKHIIVFFAMAACFAGASMIVGIVSFKSVLLIAACSYALLTAALKFAAARREPFTGLSVDLSVSLNGKTAKFKVLRDTGNSLRDPLNGTILPTVNYGEVAELFTPEVKAVLGSTRPATDKFTELSKLPLTVKLIPYRAVGTNRGLLICFKADSVTADGETRESQWVAISPTTINSYGGLL
ncbi:MAG: sigma-E processing peptidase SpoIIGA [Oscillospiraceae bacterium]|jgi:stage II sporulation protein GA (sporulation sigma-E factor processing peptidase)|nr:sigma-E processing peptidase SpoIIGA [Oscillospiraceae bacterium]